MKKKQNLRGLLRAEYALTLWSRWPSQNHSVEFQESAVLSGQLLNILLKISQPPHPFFFLRNFKRGNAWEHLVSETLVTAAILKLSSLFLVFTWMTQFCTAEELSAEKSSHGNGIKWGGMKIRVCHRLWYALTDGICTWCIQVSKHYVSCTW